MTTSSTTAAQTAVLCDPHAPAAAAVRAHVQAHDPGVVPWYPLRDVNHLNDAIVAGQVRRVVVHCPDDLLPAIWSGALDLATWSAAGATLEFVAPWPQAPQAQAETLCASWRHWQRRTHRQQVVAGAVLSAAAIAAAFALLWCLG